MGAVYDKYYKEVYNDACAVADENFWSYLENTEDLDEAWDDFYEDLFIDDSVTGNGSGSYWFNSKKAEESLGAFIWDEDIVWLLEAMGGNIGDIVNRGPEVADVIIRCEMLGQVEKDIHDYVEEKWA